MAPGSGIQLIYLLSWTFVQSANKSTLHWTVLFTNGQNICGFSIELLEALWWCDSQSTFRFSDPGIKSALGVMLRGRHKFQRSRGTWLQMVDTVAPAPFCSHISLQFNYQFESEPECLICLWKMLSLHDLLLAIILHWCAMVFLTTNDPLSECSDALLPIPDCLHRSGLWLMVDMR